MSGTPDPTPTISGLYPTFLLCYLIESCDLRFTLHRLADPVVTASSSISRVPMACCLFGFSPDNVFTTFWTMDIVFTRRLQIPKFRISSSLVMQFQNSALISTLRAHSRLQISALNQFHRLIPEIIAWRDCPDCHELRFVCIWS